MYQGQHLEAVFSENRHRMFITPQPDTLKHVRSEAITVVTVTPCSLIQVYYYQIARRHTHSIVLFTSKQPYYNAVCKDVTQSR
jgi:hypothetical protein